MGRARVANVRECVATATMCLGSRYVLLVRGVVTNSVRACVAVTAAALGSPGLGWVPGVAVAAVVNPSTATPRPLTQAMLLFRLS